MDYKYVRSFDLATQNSQKMLSLLSSMVLDFKMLNKEGHVAKAEAKRDHIHTVLDSLLDSLNSMGYYHNKLLDGNSSSGVHYD